MGLWPVVIFVVLAEVSGLSRNPVFPEIYNEGLASRQASRIVSGWEAEEEQFPHQLALRLVYASGQVTACGASIIHEEWGLTAAHCTAGFANVVVRAGVVNLTTPYFLFETSEYYNHPDYNSNFPDYVQAHDIGVIKFGLKLSFNSQVKPVRLQSSVHQNRNYDRDVLVVSGFGYTSTFGTSSPEHLNWVYLRGITNAICRVWYSNSPVIVPSTICAEYYNVTSQSPCHGDSGGPLTIVDVDGELSQVGVASFVSGRGCHTADPAGFVRPGHYHQWIKEVTGEDFDWDPTRLEESRKESKEGFRENSEYSGHIISDINSV